MEIGTSDSREIDDEGYLVVRKLISTAPSNANQSYSVSEIRAAALYIHNTPVAVLKQLPADSIDRLSNFIRDFSAGNSFSQMDAYYFVNTVKAMKDVGL